MKDLTVVYYTANHLKTNFFEKTKSCLLEAVDDYPLITVSHKPLDFGQNIVVTNLDRSYLSLYKQILIGIQAANTEFVALAEDDVLYHKDHFSRYRPSKGVFGYNLNKWSIYTWSKTPIFSHKHRRTNLSLICHREDLIEALKERLLVVEENLELLPYLAEPSRYESQLKITHRVAEKFFSKTPIVVFSHPEAIHYDMVGERKALGELQAYEIPYWGKAEDVIKYYNV